MSSKNRFSNNTVCLVFFIGILMQKRLILKGIMFALGFTISNASADSLFTRLEICTESTASINCSIVLAEGCGAEVGPANSSYFGKVGKRLKIKFDFSKDGCGAQGAYRYESSGKSIDAEGCIDSRRMDFIEYGNSRNIVRASFAGDVDGNGYRGKWKSKNGDHKEYGFFLYPSPIY